MYPILFRIGSFEITSFGVMVALGALVGLSILRRELAFSRLPEDALNGAIAGVIAGLMGAKLLWTLEHLGEEPTLDLLLSRSGLSWFGGLAGGVGTALVYFKIRRMPILEIIAAATPALALGHAIGRIGCFLVGDDYGRPTNLPWGVAFPEGLPPTLARVHPTQLYEAIVLMVIAVLLVRWRRSGLGASIVLSRYLILAGATRFLIEFLRINQRVLLGLTWAHFGSLAKIAAGVILMLASARQAAPAPSH
jgi:phosphatidylglycerol:prolipoprotein diacylglycerol transferase